MNVTFSVYRYNPDVDNVPHMKEYRLDIPEGSDMMVLDALIQPRHRLHKLALQLLT